VLSGTFKNVTGTPEAAVAQDALTATHPAMVDWGCFSTSIEGHDFFLAKLDVTHLWMINIYGGAAIIDPDEYFGVVLENKEAKVQKA